MKEARKRPDWDSFYLAQAFVASDKSLDPDTQHGCVIVSKDNRPISSACNGPIRNSVDENIPMDRPDKYDYIIHAEENAILFYSGSKFDIDGATAYITGRPCKRCLRMLIQKGIKRIVYANMESRCVDVDDLRIQNKMIEMLNDSDISIEMYPYKGKIIEILDGRLKYLRERVLDAE